MNVIGNSKLFGLLADTSEAANEEMQSAYEGFVEQVKTVGSSEDRETVFRMLNLTRIETVHLGNQYGQGKKCA